MSEAIIKCNVCGETYSDPRYVCCDELAAAQAEIARLKEENQDLKGALSLINPELKKIANAYEQLQSALDVAVEGLEKYEDIAVEAFTADLVYRDVLVASEALEKIKQIRSDGV